MPIKVSRDIAVSNLTALIARDEYVLEESYSGEEEADEDVDEVKCYVISSKRIFTKSVFNTIVLDQRWRSEAVAATLTAK